MKQLASFLFCLVLLISCQNTEQADRSGTASTSGSVQDARANDGNFSPPISPGDSYNTTVITKDYWVIEFYVPFDQSYEKKMANKGRWYKFKNDGTYVCGQWQEETSFGSWRYGRSAMGELTIVTDAKNDRFDGEWQFQIGSGATEMSWAGQQSFGVEEGTMCKVINLTSKPTKKQFGVEE